MTHPTRKTIYLHVGTHKTGTTALQKFLRDNAELLKEQQFMYPLLSNSKEFNHCYIKSLEDWQRVVLTESFNYIFSCENLYDKLFDCADFFKAQQENFNITIIIYLKRQDLMTQSVYNQLIKGASYYGDIKNFDNYQYDYVHFLEKVSALFGKEAIIVRPYEQEQLVNNDIIDDFLTLLNIKINKNFIIDQNKLANPSLTPSLIDYFKVLNKANVDQKLKRQIHLAIADQTIAGNKAGLYKNHGLLSPRQRFDILQNYQASNEKIAREYLGRSDGKLFYEALPDPNQTWQAPPKLDVALAEEITQTIYRQQKELVLKLYKHLSHILEMSPLDEKGDYTDVQTIYHAIRTSLDQYDKQMIMHEILFEQSPTLLSQFDLKCEINGSNFLEKLSKKSKDVSSLCNNNGCLMLSSSGDDPYIILKPLENVDKHQAFIVNITIEPPQETTIQCFYKLDHEDHFSPQTMLSQSLHLGKNTLCFYIDHPNFNGQLRIDVGDCIGVYKIENIIVKSGYVSESLPIKV